MERFMLTIWSIRIESIVFLVKEGYTDLFYKLLLDEERRLIIFFTKIVYEF